MAGRRWQARSVRAPVTVAWCCLFLFGLAGRPAAGAPAADEVRAGFAACDITPALGQREAHAVARHVFKSFVDPCHVRAAVFASGGRRVALVGVDALMLPRAVVVAARAEIQHRIGLEPGAVMIAATHSHSSGPVGLVQPGEFDHAAPDIRRLAYEESSLADAEYLVRVREAIVAAVEAANVNLVPARLGYGVGREERVPFNRRQRMRQGVTWSHAGAMNPDILEPAGPTDPDVGVLGAWDAGGQLLGVIVNFACHATTNPGGVSANWPGEMERVVQGALRTRAPVLFLAGPSGDVTQVDNLSPLVRPDPLTWLRQVGGLIEAEVVKTLLTMPRAANATLAARSRTWEIARRVPAPERVEEARRVVAAGKPARELTEWTFARETLLLDAILPRSPRVEVEVQVLQVGPAVFVSSPAEYFVAFGLEIKRQSPFAFTFPVSLANGCVGYVPDEAAFGPGGGGYETRLTFYSNLEITAGRQFATTGLALARELTPDAAPAWPRISAPGQPWPHGRVEPQVR